MIVRYTKGPDTIVYKLAPCIHLCMLYIATLVHALYAVYVCLLAWHKTL